MEAEILIPLFEEKSPPELTDPNLSEQGFKTTRTITQDQDDVYHTKRSAFNLGARRIFMANGFVDKPANDNRRVSLIVLDIWLHSTRHDHRFSSMAINFSVEDGPASTTKSDPQIINRAPFKDHTEVNRSVEQERVKTSWGGELGGEYYLHLGVRHDKEKETQKERVFHEVWESSLTSNDTSGMYNGIILTGLANKSQGHTTGLYGTIRVAVLVLRKEAQPLNGRFQIRTEAGFPQDVKNKLRRWFGFDPSEVVAQWDGSDGYKHKVYPEGDQIESKIDIDRLGLLVTDDKLLASLVSVGKPTP